MTKDEALKMAIDGLEIHQKDILDACKEALEQPTTQEPVASRFKLSDGNYSLHNNQYDFGEPLYTHPKEWQGLSNDEILDIKVKAGLGNWYDFSHAIEAKLKEKNT